MKAVFAALIFFVLPNFAMAQKNNTSLTSTQMHRAEMIGTELRCLVCQNESIQDSSSLLAIQLRTIIRQQVSEGVSSQKIKQYMVQRYGIFILLEPPFTPVTFLLYGSPFFALFFGVLTFYLSRRQLIKHIKPLTKAETMRLDELLK